MDFYCRWMQFKMVSNLVRKLNFIIFTNVSQYISCFVQRLNDLCKYSKILFSSQYKNKISNGQFILKMRHDTKTYNQTVEEDPRFFSKLALVRSSRRHRVEQKNEDIQTPKLLYNKLVEHMMSVVGIFFYSIFWWSRIGHCIAISWTKENWWRNIMNV